VTRARWMRELRPASTSCRFVSDRKGITLEAFTRLVRELGALLPDGLDGRVDVPSYSRKLYENAELVIACPSDGTQVGLAAFYANDVAAKRAYVSLLGVTPKYSGRGIATALLHMMFDILEEKAFIDVSIRVHRDNARAIHMYSRCGFSLVSEEDRRLLMVAPVREGRRHTRATTR
jgi:ribosomal protein S18 acetylase RimI-like enzyme